MLITSFRAHGIGIAAAMLAAVLATGTATAAPKAPAKKKIAIVGHFVFNAGTSAFDDQHFTPRKFDIRSGGTVTLRNKSRTRTRTRSRS